MGQVFFALADQVFLHQLDGGLPGHRELADRACARAADHQVSVAQAAGERGRGREQPAGTPGALMGPAMAVQKELMSIPDFGSTDDRPFAEELKVVEQMKKAILMVAGAAVQKLMLQIESEQEILMHIADMAIDVFHAETALLRAIKLVERKGEAQCGFELDIARTFLYDAADRVHKHGKDALNAFATGDEQRMMLMGMRRFTKMAPFNTKDARRRIAAKL
mgnify:CR=1 FL=1